MSTPQITILFSSYNPLVGFLSYTPNELDANVQQAQRLVPTAKRLGLYRLPIQSLLMGSRSLTDLEAAALLVFAAELFLLEELGPRDQIRDAATVFRVILNTLDLGYGLTRELREEIDGLRRQVNFIKDVLCALTIVTMVM